jgi:hypothetical protein
MLIFVKFSAFFNAFSERFDGKITKKWKIKTNIFGFYLDNIECDHDSFVFLDKINKLIKTVHKNPFNGHKKFKFKICQTDKQNHHIFIIQFPCKISLFSSKNQLIIPAYPIVTMSRPWKDAATLIVLARDAAKTSKYDYKVRINSHLMIMIKG